MTMTREQLEAVVGGCVVDRLSFGGPLTVNLVEREDGRAVLLIEDFQPEGLFEMVDIGAWSDVSNVLDMVGNVA